jgi:hypothetical protein
LETNQQRLEHSSYMFLEPIQCWALSYLTMLSHSYDVFLMFILNSDIWETWRHDQHSLVHTLTHAKQLELNHVQQKGSIHWPCVVEHLSPTHMHHSHQAPKKENWKKMFLNCSMIPNYSISLENNDVTLGLWMIHEKQKTMVTTSTNYQMNYV